MKFKDVVDITEHTLPTILVGIAMGFACAFGLHAPNQSWDLLFVPGSAIGAFVLICLWIERERRQHDGHLGGEQSWREAWIPFWSGIITYPIATYFFYYHPI